MKSIAAALALCLASPAFADWSPSIEEGEKSAKSEGKLMLVFIHSNQCHVCKGMEKNIWPNIGVQTELENWISVKIDAAVAVQSKWRWKIDDVPQMRVVDPEGNTFREYTRNQFPHDSPDKMMDFLKGVRGEWDKEIRSRVFEWEASVAEGKAKSKDRQRPILYFVYESGPTSELALKYPIFLDKTVTAPSKKFVCVAAPREAKDVWDRYKPQAVPGFVAVDLDGNELHRFGLLAPAELAAELEIATKKFDESQILDPAQALERDLSRWDAALKSDAEQDKLDAAQKLIDSKDAKVVKPLAKGFNDPSVKLKELLITAMISIDVKNGLPLLLSWVVKEENNKLAVKGWDAVGVTCDLRAVGALEDRILEASMEVSTARIKALGNMKDKKVVDFLIELPFKFKTGGGKGGRGPGGGGGLRNAVKNSLNKLTGQDFGEDWLEWKKWWRDNQKSFKFAD